jgi:hypothetical protein
VIYVVKDIFTTRNGSWEPLDQTGSIPQWARDEYLKPFDAPDYFDDAGGDHHLFAAVIGLDGKLVRGQEIIYWSDGFDMLGDPEYDNYEVVCGGGLPANNHISFFVVWQAVPATVEGEEPDEDHDNNIYLPTTPKISPAATGEPAPAFDPGSLWIQMFRQAAWNRLGLELAVDSLVAAYARGQQLGMPVTQEFELNGHRVQGFHGGIVIMPIGQAQRISHVPW